jgi:hypothetical protein
MNVILVTMHGIIPIVKTGLTTKNYVAVLSVLNLVFDFVKCNRPRTSSKRGGHGGI